ncbi:BCCT transporter [Candidatus Photodesmus blepharus]|uniref:Sigma factor-binding protein Crl n=1 Tax=Candidatus Photodesmus blepharonis TaxID=1179155 RepID=A0A084CPD7_9GAMM|nr:sigma factor-binding protein Crl [Candidatus Photodesmus blepharus]KEY91666.1 BCCT transporter [Candidatus Photodesmus blepharus]
MSEMTQKPTHYRLLSTLREIGPYLRESKSNKGSYILDCLSACVDDSRSPEKREFWGWWLELEHLEKSFQARYHTGRYDISGDWKVEAIPQNALSEVNRTQSDFHDKLVSTVRNRFEMNVELHEESVKFV